MLEKLAKNKRFSLLLIFVSAFLLSLSILNHKTEPEVKPVPLAEIMAELEDEDKAAALEEVRLDDVQRNVTLVYEDEDRAHKTSSYPTDYGVKILDAAEDSDVKAEVKNNFNVPRTFLDVVLSLIPLILIFALLAYLATSMTSGRSSAKAISEIPTTRFEDLAGVDEAVEDMGEITDFLKNTGRFTAIGAKAPKGALLSGPPGTGKTMLARAVAGEAGVPFFHATGSDFQEMFVGLGARRVRNLFKAAKKYDRAIIFIDEIDSVGGKRGGGGDGPDSREHSRTINALLSEMDGFEESNVIVLAATNNPEQLDPALTRAGRFDRKITVDLPDWKGRQGILEIHSREKPLAEDVDFEVLAKTTVGLSGAELANLVNEALINAVRHGREAATHEDFMEALSTVTLGRARRSAVMTDHDKDVIATHEAGHAIVGLALDEISDPSHITIVPRGFSGGHTKLQESENRFETSRSLKARLAMMMGGLAAERFAFNDITQGPGHDLEAATNLANKMIAKMGMGSTYSVVADQSIMVNSAVSEGVRGQVEELIVEAIGRATAVINDPQWNAAFQELRALLLEQDTIEADEIQALKARARGV